MVSNAPPAAGPSATAQQNALVRMEDSGDYTIVELAELLKVSRPTVYRVLERARARHDAGARDQTAVPATALPLDSRPLPDVAK